MGICVWMIEVEYNFEIGEWYNGVVSWFVIVIDVYDMVVYCNVLTERKYCKFIMIRDGSEDVIMVELDE